MMNKYDDFGKELLAVYDKCRLRDGSEAFDSLASIHQYYLLYNIFYKYIPQGANVLDWGSGSGHFTYFMMKYGYNPTSFGFDKPGIFESVPTDMKLNFVHGRSHEPTQLPFLSEQFDAVSSVGVLEHVREFGGSEEASLLELHRILKKNGIFVCYHFPNRYSWIEFLSRLLGKWSHQHLYSRADIDQLFPKDSWKILECRRYAMLPRNILGKLLKGGLRNSEAAAKIIDMSDSVLTYFFRAFAQNWLVVARKH